MANIHPTALVDPKAQIDESVRIGPYTVIGPDVRVGAGTSIGSHCVIEGCTTIGRNNQIFHFNALGGQPQDKKYTGERSELVIGDHNTIREYCSFNVGVKAAGGVTRIGDHNWIMGYTHIAHDCQLGHHITIANYTGLAGHVHLGDWVTIGGLSGLHQFVRVGAHAMIGFSSAISQDVPPFMLVDGNPPANRGFNSVGLRRRGFSDARIAVIKQMHRLLYRDGKTLEEARAAIEALNREPEFSESADDILAMLEFLQLSMRGISR
ncbi:MAG: acyl-ACP--UDP-N-acetylglucosamine O-acyltransferase [Burkholderiaceae bacterium]|nr:acyl-ACP--UDP-N-acetylglucosamine O-acyltransferase [Burkholderiaceae bacterium]